MGICGRSFSVTHRFPIPTRRPALGFDWQTPTCIEMPIRVPPTAYMSPAGQQPVANADAGMNWWSDGRYWPGPRGAKSRSSPAMVLAPNCPRAYLPSKHCHSVTVSASCRVMRRGVIKPSVLGCRRGQGRPSRAVFQLLTPPTPRWLKDGVQPHPLESGDDGELYKRNTLADPFSFRGNLLCGRRRGSLSVRRHQMHCSEARYQFFTALTNTQSSHSRSQRVLPDMSARTAGRCNSSGESKSDGPKCGRKSCVPWTIT
ncbi:hypothetical protein QBC34DRAFT_115335 [Podospora aff. communis PSN243]|uniref:Uncharacterized protein n=1 Tax=Podospora aff. communis PSN243 TaxID=3040156 RepID=A0AAV9GJ29_9PEZI|nr:hypothetical protein QBC34DRAFT_115335 [Podospora aff. communis PSN243]